MKQRSRRWRAKNGAALKRNRKNRARRRDDPELTALRNAFAAQDQATGHHGYPPPEDGRHHGISVIRVELTPDDFEFDDD